MLSSVELNNLSAAINQIADVMGPDATLRQVQTLIVVALGGQAGVEQTTVEKRTDSSQSTTSRNLKLLGPNLGLTEFFLDQHDGRRRMARVTKAGEKLLTKVLTTLGVK